ncbi:transcription initiation factor TFIID subunit 3 [Monosporozyma servazzii]
MTATDDFYFSLLRVSMLQLLKSIGFDKSKPSTVDIFTDLYVKWLELMLKDVNKLAMARQSGETDDNNNIALQDITQAMINLGQIKPVDLLDIYDENPNLPSDQGLQLLKNWCINDAQLQYVKNVALPPIDVIKDDMTKKIETMTSTKHGFTIGPTKDASNENLRNSNPNIPSVNNNSTANSNTNDYLNKLQTGQNGIPDEDIQKEIAKQEEIMDEIINNGDTDDWIKFVLIRQRLNIWNKKPLNSLPSSINQLSNISGLKNSLLNTMLQATMDNSNTAPASAMKTNSDYLPIIPEQNLNTSNTDIINTDNDNSKEEREYLKRAKEYMQKLPAMSKENRLENITLSYENEEFDSESDISERADDPSNDVEMDDSQKEDAAQEMHNIYPDPIEESSNFQLTGSINDNMESEDGDVNNLELAAMEDMDNTFQRRQSLDFGHPF